MIRLIIADDEEYERTFLSRVIEEHYTGVIDIVYAARDGAELVEKAAELHPDLILMDIRMPRMDGLEAAAQLRQILPRAQIVIVSAYGQFSYAKRAIQLGVRDFLVKPYLNEELIDTLSKILAGMETADAGEGVQDRREPPESAERDLVWDLAFDRRNDAFLQGTLTAHGIEGRTLKCLTFYHEGIRKLGSTGRQIIRRFFERPAVSVVSDDLLGLMAVYLLSDAEITYSELNTAIRKTKEYLAGLESSPVFCGVSGAYGSLADAGQAFREASAYIENYSDAETGERCRHTAGDVRGICDLEQRLCFFILSHNRRQEDRCADQLLRILGAYYPPESEMLGSALMRILFTILHRLASRLGTAPDGGEAEQLLRLCTEKMPDSRAMLDQALSFFGSMAEQRPVSPGSVQTVRRARLYLAEHYSQALSLKDVADVLGVSAGYLSKSFKANGGDSFTEYLTEVRLEAAKRMMRETELSISDISYEVGFSDPGYFSKCFRKHESISPSDYAAMQRMARQPETGL